MMALQSCPFCGSARVLPECSGRVQQLVCLACGARGPEVARILPAADAEAAWNSRKGVLPSDHVNAAGILGGDMPATVVQKLDAAARAAGVPGTEAPSLTWCEHCGEGVTDFCRGKLRLCPKGLRVLHRNAGVLAAETQQEKP